MLEWVALLYSTTSTIYPAAHPDKQLLIVVPVFINQILPWPDDGMQSQIMRIPVLFILDMVYLFGDRHTHVECSANCSICVSSKNKRNPSHCQ